MDVPAARRQISFESLENRLALAVITVNSLLDGPVNLTDSVVTLRDAVHAANENLQVAPGGPTGIGADEIRFQAGIAGMITLNQGLLAIRSDMSISGPGANVLTISGNNAFRVFDVNEGVDAALKIVSLSGLTISNGSYLSYHGGGITNRENLTITGCTIRDSFAGVSGGGIFNFASGTLTVQNSTLSGNAALGDGGGITSHGTLTVQNSTISGNAANFSGGAIASFGNVVTIQNSTLTNNRAEADVDAQGEGGGIWFVDTTVRLHNSIVSGNFKFNGNTTPSDIVAYNGGVNVVSSNNLIGIGGSGGLLNGVNGNKVGVANPGLAPLANNGGPTLTHALFAGSPAFNAGNNSQALGATDQRGEGFARIAHGTVDIGAFETPVFTGAFIVDTAVDEDDGNYNSGDLSLREAVNLANAAPGADVIVFSSFFNAPRTINLMQGQLGLRSDLEIRGPGAALLTIDASNLSRVLDVADFSPTASTVAISGMTITGGNSPSYSGGGIINRENLTITGCIIRNNSSGISAGGISNFNDATLTMAFSTVSDNSAPLDGGGVVTFGNMTVRNSTISGNQTGGSGGGVYNRGTLLLENTTVSGNSADEGGGIIQLGELNARNCTIANNTAVLISTITQGGGLYLGGGSCTLENTIVASNFSVSSSLTIRDDIRAHPTVQINGSYNLISSPNAPGLANGVNGNKINVSDAGLAPLGFNGGPTRTHALLVGSPAFNAGNPNFVPPPNSDQRGAPYVRVFDGRIEIGALEVQLEPASADFDQDNDVDGNDFLRWQRGFGITAPEALQSQGDADNDQDVDGADLAVWKAHFGSVPSMVAASAGADTSNFAAHAELAMEPMTGQPALSSDLVDAAMAYDQAVADENNFKPRSRSRFALSTSQAR